MTVPEPGTGTRTGTGTRIGTGAGVGPPGALSRALSPSVLAALTTAAAEALAIRPELGHGDPSPWRAEAVLCALSTALRSADDAAVLALAGAYDRLLGVAPQVRAGSVVLVDAGIAERRRRGSFATPPLLAAELARRALPTAAATIVDPACGAGALLLAALERLVGLGIPPGEAVSRLCGVDADPVAVALCRAALSARARQLGAGHGAGPRIVCGDALLGPTPSVLGSSEGVSPDGDLGADGERGPGHEDDPGPAVIWHRRFPDVLDQAGASVEPVTGWRGGFEAVLANPPWERLKVFRREQLAPAPSEELRRRRAAQSRAVRAGGRHPLTGRGEVNAYLPFVETCWRLLAPDGRAAVLVPAGIGADRSAAELMQALLASGSLGSLHLLSTDRAVFAGVSARVGVAVLGLRHGAHPPPGRRADAPAAQVAVDVGDPGSIPPEKVWSLDAAMPALVNPNTRTLPLCGSARDADLLVRAHRRWPVLVRHGSVGEAGETGEVGEVGEVGAGNPWRVRLVTPLHMTRDAVHFRPAPGPGLLPLWEAKHAGLLDHHGGARAEHRYWVPESLVAQRFPALVARGWLGAYRNVTTTDSPRTLLPCVLPVAGVGNSLPLIDAPRLPLLLSALAALPIDYLVRQKHAGANLNFFKLEQAAVPPPESYDQPAPWTRGRPLASWVLDRFAAALRWDSSLAPLARELAALGVDVPAAIERCPREQALAELDAAHALMLSWRRADLEQVLGTFGALRTRETRTHGRFLTGVRVLEAYDRLTS